MLVKRKGNRHVLAEGGGGVMDADMGCDVTSGIDTLLLLGTHLSRVMHH